MNSFLIALSAFLTVASSTAPPDTIKNIADVSKTCVYLSTQDVPIPRQCEKVIKDLNDCANNRINLPYCYALIGENNRGK